MSDHSMMREKITFLKYLINSVETRPLSWVCAICPTEDDV